MTPILRSCVIAVMLVLAGCSAPAARLTFPPAPCIRSQVGWFYDVAHHGHIDFALLANPSGRLDAVAYDDAGDGRFNRIYRLPEYSIDRVAHLIVLLDSIPFEAIAERYRLGDFAWFDPPQKVIPPFPSLTEICYSRLLDAPPLPGMVDDYYDMQNSSRSNTLWQRLLVGYREPWERRLDFSSSFMESGLSYLDPRPWYVSELAEARATFDASPNGVTLVYLGSASAMLSRYGRAGLNEVLDGVQQLCVELLYERQGAIKITLLADHGHNLMATKNISLEPWLKSAGFHVASILQKPNDVVLELHGLVTYTGVRTMRAAAVATALCKCPQVDLVAYMDADRVIVRNSSGAAAIESYHGRLRYLPLDCDVLRYSAILHELRRANRISADGTVSDEDWFSATVDAEYPDAPRRLWDAFHGTVSHPPEVMVNTRDGFCAGRPDFEQFIHMASTHGSLNQSNSATFVMTMTGRARRPLRTGEVLATIQPNWTPRVQAR